ncbi:MAG: glycoside hydrolase family 31 protein [Prevotellaceae bacterium]|nr:glycoside hydrolase family 31 protein [Prevotellaceae bacterium]
MSKIKKNYILGRTMTNPLSFTLLLCFLSYAIAISAQIKPITIPTKNDTLLLYPLADNAVRVQYKSKSNRMLPEWIYAGKNAEHAAAYKIKRSKESVRVCLKGISLTYHKSTGLISWFDASGKPLLAETNRSLQMSAIQGEPTYIATLHVDSPQEEYLFGLGQFQDGHLNVRGLSRRLTQVNTQIAVPFIYSSRGFGLLWNNYGMTEFNPCDTRILLKKQGESGEKYIVDVTTTEGGRQEVRESNHFEGTMTVTKPGRYSLLLDVGQKMARTHHLAIDGETIIEMKNRWLPPTASVIVDLEAGTHRLQANLEKGDMLVLYYKKVEDETVFQSPVAEAVDYTVFAGEADDVIASYRSLIGQAPMMPDWAMGYIHCRERFTSQSQILETARRFQAEQIPMDVIVQDWQYWGKYGWNAMRFDETHYPAPGQLVEDLHDMNVKLMLSVWSKIDPKSEVGKQMANDGFFIKNTSWVDFFNPKASASYWSNFSNRLLKPYHIDAWWQDATEPENDDLEGRKVMNNNVPGEVFRNVYPLLVNKTVYEGCRKDMPDKRTMILTRSGFPGIQRYGAALWSGDIGHDWETLRRQLTAGLGLTVTGIPWWTYDAGGFFRPGRQYTDEAYHECFLRWLQISTFLPLMRVHGYKTDTEFWNYGDKVETLARQAVNLRYRLLPYIYSANAEIAMKGGTLMRPLVMDFRTDAQALQQSSQYMFGKSLLVAPVVEKGLNEMNVYLPETKSGWYDFHTGRKMKRMRCNVTVPVKMEYIPVFVKAGTILPLAEVRQQAHASLNSPWEIRIYPGADGAFTIYEDDGISYQYEEGHYATFCLKWDDKKSILTIQARKGDFPELRKCRKLKILKIISEHQTVEQEVEYKGQKLSVSL